MKISPLDKLFSEVIRTRAMKRVHGCERCLSCKIDYKQLQCSHFWGRAKKSVRYDEDNAAGLCSGCHMYFTAHPHEHNEWFRERLGQGGFDLLTSRANRTHPKIDENLIGIYLRERIKEALNE